MQVVCLVEVLILESEKNSITFQKSGFKGDGCYPVQLSTLSHISPLRNGRGMRELLCIVLVKYYNIITHSISNRF